MEVPRLGVQSELQLPAYITATAMWDLSLVCLVCDLHHSSRQCQILSPLIEARDRTHNLMVPRRIRFHCTTVGTPMFVLSIPVPLAPDTVPDRAGLQQTRVECMDPALRVLQTRLETDGDKAELPLCLKEWWVHECVMFFIFFFFNV